MFRVALYRRPNGRSPYEEYLGELPLQQAATIRAFVNRLAELGSARMALKGWRRKLNDIWELRPGSQRLFYFWDGITQQYILLNGYRKQRGKGNRHEIQRAERLRHAYLRENKGETMTDNALKEIEEWLQDDAHRRAYGSENIRLDLAIVLAEARQSAGLTQKKLAEMSGVSQAYIAKLESGAANPTIGHVGALVASMRLRLRFKFEPLSTSGSSNPLPAETTPSSYEDDVLDRLP